jgi:hypothetical protein
MCEGLLLYNDTCKRLQFELTAKDWAEEMSIILNYYFLDEDNCKDES